MVKCLEGRKKDRKIESKKGRDGRREKERKEQKKGSREGKYGKEKVTTYPYPPTHINKCNRQSNQDRN